MIIALLLAAASAVPELPKDVPASATMYEVVMMGSAAGQLAAWSEGGALRVFFQYNDRGRGPKTYSTLQLAPDGTPRSVLVEGTDYMKAALRETFSLQDGVATWKNKAESGSRRLQGPAFYLSMYGAPLEAALLADAARRNGGAMPLLPSGEARVRKLAARGAATLYEVSGLDFSPSYVWLDRQGRLFATWDPWMSIVRDGQQKALPGLAAVQKRAVAERAREQARRLMHRPAGKLVFHDVSVFDAESARLEPHRDVVVEGSRIVSVAPAGEAPSGAEVIDGAGRTLLPGLWDLHAHVADNDGLLNLAAGVTSVRDMANDNEELAARIARIGKGEEIGTRIVRAGIIDGQGPRHAPTKVLVANADQARKWVDWYADHGFVQVKLYSSLDPALVPGIAAEAHRSGLRVSGHIPSGTYADVCVKQGYDEIQHVNFLLLNFMRDVTDTAGPERFTAVVQRAADLDLGSAPVREFVSLLAERHVAVDPTLSVFERLFLAKPGMIPQGLAPVADRLPPQIRRFLLSGELAIPESQEGRARASFDKALALVRELWEAGVHVEAGTDNMAGFSLQRELELEVQAGIPAPRALQAATLGAAQLLGLDRDLGLVRAARLADLVLIDGDPLRDISAVRKVALTVRDGVIYRPAELERELGMAPR